MNSGGKRFGKAMRDMQKLDAWKNGRSDASASAGELPTAARVDISAAERNVREARAGKRQGGGGASAMAGERNLGATQ
jgi:hypothetical protein